MTKPGPARPSRIKGESFVWLTGTGLALALVMAAVLLLVILRNGATVFWPNRVVELHLEQGGSTTVVAGELMDSRITYSGEAGVAGIEEWKVYTGNRDVYRSAFRFVPATAVREQRMPDDVLVVERSEYGNAIGRPQALLVKGADGKVEIVAAGDARFEPELDKLLDETRDRWRAIRVIEKEHIGANSERITALERERKRTSDATALAAIDQRLVVLRQEFKQLKSEATALRVKQAVTKLRLTLAGGETKDIALGKIVGLTWPNREGLFGRLGIFASRLWTFVSDEPREANTEGGIFPAIFGTFTMTLLMTMAVVPFGVIAAIYLREYAKQGPMVRMVRIAVNNLAGVPSIVFGVFGLGFFVYLVGGTIDQLFFGSSLPQPTFGTGGMLWASATLALMTVPVVIVATEEAIAAVPRGMREGSLACGASKWQTISRIVLPGAIPGILTGAILAMARGAGEVAPLMLVGVVKLAPTLPVNGDYPFVHFDQKFMHLGFHIYDLAFQSPDSEAARPSVFATTFFLILLVLIMNLAAILLRERVRKRMKTGAF